MSDLRIVYRDIDSLVEYEGNSRTHNSEQVDKIVASIGEFGFTNPLLVGPDGVLVAGHGRMMAAKKLGIDSVPCIELGHLTSEQRRAYVIADNRLAMDSGWDEDALAKELAALNDADFNLHLLGFDELELDEILIDEESLETDGLTDDDAVPEVVTDPVTSEGDVWILGNHRLCCGDSTSIADVDELLGGGRPVRRMLDGPAV
jgi:ParB-like chromosome segregation protein Spo0J